MPIELILGGARSGKSRFAQAQAEASFLEPTLIATAQREFPNLGADGKGPGKRGGRRDGQFDGPRRAG